MKRRIHILGVRGMLGAAIQWQSLNGWRASGRGNFPVTLTATGQRIRLDDIGSLYREFENNVMDGDVIVNCIGVIPEKAQDNVDLVTGNALVPHVVAAAAAKRRAGVIHVSTDCVFNPNQGIGGYGLLSARWNPAPTDLYGRSKLAGEVDAPHVINVRTSFVGPDHGLWKWLADQPKGATIEGYLRAQWSGSNVWTVAEYLLGLALELFTVGWEELAYPNVIHLSTKDPISKFELLNILAGHLGRTDLNIVGAMEPYVNRSLTPTSGRFTLPPFKEAFDDVPFL